MPHYYKIDLTHRRSAAALREIRSEFAKDRPTHVLGVNPNADNTVAWVKTLRPIQLGDEMLLHVTEADHDIVLADVYTPGWYPPEDE